MRTEDDDMSDALMNDMADALRSAGLGSMVESDDVEADEEADSSDASINDSEQEPKEMIDLGSDET